MQPWWTWDLKTFLKRRLPWLKYIEAVRQSFRSDIPRHVPVFLLLSAAQFHSRSSKVWLLMMWHSFTVSIFRVVKNKQTTAIFCATHENILDLYLGMGIIRNVTILFAIPIPLYDSISDSLEKADVLKEL